MFDDVSELSNAEAFYKSTSIWSLISRTKAVESTCAVTANVEQSNVSPLLHLTSNFLDPSLIKITPIIAVRLKIRLPLPIILNHTNYFLTVILRKSPKNSENYIFAINYLK